MIVIDNIEVFTIDDITKDDQPIIRKIAEPVIFPLNKLQITALSNMKNYLHYSNLEEADEKLFIPAVGIAAPQVNCSSRILLFRFFDEQTETESTVTMINPEIIGQSTNLTFIDSGEACLSVFKTHEGYIHRAFKVVVKFFDEANNRQQKNYTGFNAVVVQHEIDHLNGVLFYDHIKKNDPFFIPDNSIML